MAGGVGLFGTFTAYVASLFSLQEEKQQEKREDEILLELKAIRGRLEKLEENSKEA
jgi:hypothetical protein